MNPQDAIASHCAALLELYPNHDRLILVREFARRELVTDRMLRKLCLALHHEEGPAREYVKALHDLLDREVDDLPVTVTELQDGETGALYRVESAAQVRIYAWPDVEGWESTGWGAAFYGDALDPVPDREDMSRDSWPVGLAAFIAEALDELNTSEPNV